MTAATDAFFAALWDRYAAIAPQAERIRRLFLEVEDEVHNDHVAFRTFDRAPFDIASLEPRLGMLGYARDHDYRFPAKRLRAWSYRHEDPELPLVFLSELEVDTLSAENQTLVERLLAEGAERLPPGPDAFHAGRLWHMPTWPEYERLEADSDYAAWLAVWGLQANHFTVDVNRLESATTLQAVVERVQAAGFPMNASGGLIKGDPNLLLEQASTLADRQAVTFADGETRDVPTCYYEFARRYETPSGELYRGFVAASADRIFESTDRR